MKKEDKNSVNVKCPVCSNTLVTKHKDEEVTGRLLHKCSKCKRYWNVNYTTKIIAWKDGKVDNTPIKKFKLDMATGKCQAIYSGNIEKALLRREGA